MSTSDTSPPPNDSSGNIRPSIANRLSGNIRPSITNRSSRDARKSGSFATDQTCASLAVRVDAESGIGGGSEAASTIGIEWDHEKPRKWSPWNDGNFALPHVEMPNEVNFMGGLGPNVGHPRSTTHIQRPTAIQKIFNMRTGNHPVFTFCEDPRKANNVVQKKEKIDYRNVNRIRKCVETVRLVQNVETPPPSDFSEDPTEIFDDENPLNLDFQGLDHQQTYQRDEQELQNRREYLIQKRSIQRKAMIKRTVQEYKIEKQQKEFGIPPMFDVDAVVEGDEDLQNPSVPPVEALWTEKYRLKKFEYEPKFQRPIPDAIPYVPPPAILAGLTRTADKEDNQKRDKEHLSKRQEKLNEMQNTKLCKDATKALIEQEQQKMEDSNKVFTIGGMDYNRHFTDEFLDLEKQHASLPPIYEEQKYPHTLRETRFMQRKMNQARRIIRDETNLRNEFNEEHMPHRPVLDVVEADEISNNASELSEQSTDDEDGMSVGQKTDVQYQLRGFQYKLGDELRGLIDVKPKSKWNRAPRSCNTRKEWFDELAQTRRDYALFNRKTESIPNKALPNDKDFILFRHKTVPPRPVGIAPVKEMIESVGEEPKIINAKPPKIKKPKYCKIRKFNLTAYIFGEQKREKAKKVIARNGATENKYGVSFDMIEKCDKMFKKKKNQNKATRHNRMRALGIPIVQFKKPDDNVVTSSDSENSDWVPNKPDVCQIPTESNTNDAVPRFREPTHQLRNPKVPSKCQLPSKDSLQFIRHSSHVVDVAKIPSLTSTSETYEVPRLSKLASDVILAPNLHIRRTDFTDLFESRHHHPHQDATQHKTVYVKYLPKVPEFKLPPGKKERAAKMKPFQRANYRQGLPLQEDLALPKLVIEDPFLDNEEEHQHVNIQQSSNIALKPPSVDARRSRKSVEDDPDKSKFRRLLYDSNQAALLLSTCDKPPVQISIEAEKFAERLKDELDSVKSCYSSNTSSECTNYTNDSGSYLDLEGIKIPCSFITKSHVPFEEIDRCRVVAGPIDKIDEYFGPYYTVPFAGQKMDMRQLSLPKDKFFTSGVRSRYGIRNRLNVHVPGFSQDQIGVKNQKRISQLATEWDEYYQNEILTRPRIAKFKPRTVIAQARDALRKKFITNYIQEAIIEKSVVAEKERLYAEEVLNFEKICNPLFSQWEETHYRKYMRKMQDVKPYYELTTQLKNELAVASSKYLSVEMSIIYMEDDWRRRTIMQNFHYLLSDPAWRQNNDWIHRQADGTLENFKESIIKRPNTNVRVRDQDSAWAVKEFYEKFFENEEARTAHIVFRDSSEFMNGLQRLKMKSFVCLLELHFAMWVLSNLTHGYNTFKTWSHTYIERREKFVKSRCAKKYFNEDLSAVQQQNAHELIAVNLHDAVAAPNLRILIALCETLFVKIVPKEVRDNMKSGADTIDKFTIIVNMVMNLLETLDQVPRNIRMAAERKVRARRSFIARQAKRTFDLETRINLTSIQMKKNLAPPYVRQPPKHPLARSVLEKKIIVKEVPKVEISEVDKLFYRAFTDESTTQIANLEHNTDEKMAILRSLEANCIPFYFDVFLRQNQYFPSYDFKTEIELREGSELKQFKYEDVLDDVLNNLRIWEMKKQRIMEENIRATWHLYSSRTLL